MRFIINADDIGISHEVNKAIEQCFKDDVITSTTIMANGKAFDEVSSIYSTFSHYSFGIHLVLDELSPLTSQDIFFKRGIVDEEGLFIKSGIKYAVIDDELKNSIFKEWCSQVEKIQSAGIKISHIDSHHHVHVIPELHSVVKEISEKYGIKRVRNNNFLPYGIKSKTKNYIFKNPQKTLQGISEEKNTISLLCKITSYAKKMNNFYRFRRDFNTTNYFMSSRFFIENKELFDKRLNPECTLELMCHPGHANYREELELLYNYRKELEKRIPYTLL